MPRKELNKERKWDIFLIVFSCLLTAVLSVGVILLTTKDTPIPQTSIAATKQVPDTTVKQQQTITSAKPKRSVHSANTATKITNKYVEVYLNINSNDRVLVNGKAASPEEISEKPNVLKLVAGSHYRIKINNCPEQEITAAQDLTISVCM